MCGVGAIMFCCMLTGCGHEHTWAEATCTEPKTCSECGKTEGEALGHTWVEATCTEAKHCNVCGETEGEPLEHTWVEATCAEAKHCDVCGETEGEPLEHTLTEANYQQAAACEVCGETVGEPLQADFEKYHLTENFVEPDKEYDLVVVCDENGHTTNAKVIFSNYQTFNSGLPETSDNIMLNMEGLKEEAGYEYKSVEIMIQFSDENAIKYGAMTAPRNEDYYDIVGHDESTVWGNDGWGQFTVNWNGTDYTDCIMAEAYAWNTNSDKTYSYHSVVIVRVPVGYDGYVYGLLNGDMGGDQYIFDLDTTDAVFFRFE